MGQNIKSISPASASQVKSIVLSIVCDNISFTSDTYGVKLVDPANSFSFINATTVTVINDTVLNATFTFNSSKKTGLYNVVIYDPPTNITAALKNNAFNLNPATNTIPAVILSASPTSAFQGDTVDVIIKTKNTFFSQPSPIDIRLQNLSHSISPISQTVLDNETIKAKFDISYFDSVGIYDVVIYNSISGMISLNKVFTVYAGSSPPQLISITPNSGKRFDSVKVTIKGKNTFFKRDSCGIALTTMLNYYTPASTIEYLSDTLMTATFDFNNQTRYKVGVYDLFVFGRKNEGSLLLPKSFTIRDTTPPPVIVSFSPLSAKQGDSLKITVKARHAHFLQNASFVALENKNGGLGGQSKVINDSTIEGTIYPEYRYAKAPAKFAVEVGAIDTMLIAIDSFTLEKGDYPPKVISITPNNIVQGKKVDLTIKGNKNTFPGPYFLKPQLSRNNSTSYVAKSYSVVNDSTLLASFEFPTDTTKLGVFDFNTSDLDATYANLVMPSSFTVNKNPTPASLSSISPSTATQFDTVLVNVNASHSHFLTGNVGAYMPASNSINGDAISINTTKVINDTLLQVKFILSANYYASTLYDMRVYSSFDGPLEIKKAFTVKQIYTQQPAIINIDPKEALRGQTITMNIKGTPKSFKPGSISVELNSYINPISSINATAVNYVNDSLITATFSFSSNDKIGTYYPHVLNQVNLYYYQNGGFTLKASPSDNKLLALSPAWASQTDTASLLLTGSNTHFNLTDTIWLENKFGQKIKPFSKNITTDTSVILKFAFTKSNLPGIYSLQWRNTGNTKLMLENVFTLTGSINSNALLDVTPKDIFCYINFGGKIVISATHTHFLSEVDTVFICNNQNGLDKGISYPSEMKILNDTTISATFFPGNNCGNFDIYVVGKENYILTDKLRATPPVTVNEEPKEDPLKIFPNPSEGVFTLNVNSDFEQGNVTIFDMYGKTIFSLDKIEQSTEIDLSTYASGIYFVKVIKGETYKTEKIIKQ